MIVFSHDHIPAGEDVSIKVLAPPDFKCGALDYPPELRAELSANFVIMEVRVGRTGDEWSCRSETLLFEVRVKNVGSEARSITLDGLREEEIEHMAFVNVRKFPREMTPIENLKGS
jgi:hypothetical protein